MNDEKDWFAQQGVVTERPFTSTTPLIGPLLARMQGLEPAGAMVRAKAAADIPANGKRESFLRAVSHVDETGQTWVTPAANQDSSLLSPFLQASLLIQRPVDAPLVPAGEIVTCLRLDA